MTDSELRQLLQSTKSVAVVGHSDKPYRDSYQIGAYLRAVNYQVFPVNPNISQVLGWPVFPALSALPQAVDMINVFRASEHMPPLVVEAIALRPKVLWTQLGVRVLPNDRELLAEAGITLVENRCIKVDHQRLFG